jgi:hypothetical protein
MEKKPDYRPLDAAMVARALDEVSEKMAEQRSAGVEAATARVVDRKLKDFKPDDTDKEAARTLKEAVTKKKRKRRVVPFKDQVWWKALLIVVALGGVAGLIYEFSRPPGPDQVYAQCESLIRDQKYQEALLGSDYSNGPLPVFLRRFPDDPRFGQVTAWQDEAWKALDVDLYEKLHRKATDARQKGELRAKGLEQSACLAVVAAEFGDPFLARRRWEATRQIADADGNPFFRHLSDAKIAELTQEIAANKMEEEPFRRALVDKKFQEAEVELKGKRRPQAELIWRELLDLYDKDADLRKRVEAARKAAREPKDDKEKGGSP